MRSSSISTITHQGGESVKLEFKESDRAISEKSIHSLLKFLAIDDTLSKVGSTCQGEYAL